MAPFFSDTFTEAAANVELPSHTPTVGTSWTKVWQDGSNPVLQAEFTPDTCGSTSANNSGVGYTADATYPSADYSVQWTHVNANNTAPRPYYVLARYVDTNNMVAVRMQNTMAGNCQIYEKVAGTWGTIGSSANVANGSVCKLDVSGTTATFYDDGVSVGTGTITATATGKAGLACGGGAVLVDTNDDANGTTEIDDFSVTDLAAGGDPEGSLLGGKLLRGGLLLHGVLGR